MTRQAMIPALNIPALVTPQCPSLPHTLSSATANQRHERYHLPLGCVLQFISVCKFPSPSPSLSTSRPVFTLLSQSLSHLPACSPHPRHCHCHCRRQDGSSTARRSGIRPVLIIIILVDYLIQIQWFKGQQVVWLVLLAAWWLNRCSEIIATVLRETLAGALNIPRAGCVRIGAIDLIPEGMGVVPPPIVHLVAGFVKHCPHI